MAGRVWTEEGFPWLVSPNLTPDLESGAGGWTDDMLARAIREGIGHDGRVLMPTMPYQSFRHMSDEDLASIVVYLRSLTPIPNSLPKTKIPFPLNRRILAVPSPVLASISQPSTSDPTSLGEYLIEMSACEGCHTIPTPEGKPTKKFAFAGGFMFQTPFGHLASANITPDASGISDFDEAMFVRVIRSGYVGARKLNPEMPWGYFRNMTDDDLRAIFSYLKTLKPIRHAVDNGEPPTYCKSCKGTHGFGERN